MIKILFTILISIYLPTTACINADGFDIFGKKTYYSWPISFIKKLDIENYKVQTLKRENELKNEYKNKPLDEYYYRELGVVKIFQKKYKDAKRLILKGLTIDSIDYGLTSNLAVIYELEGNLDSAIILMKKALSIDKYSHFGSEWIHLKILEATKNVQKNKNWIYTNNVLGLKLSKDSIPKKRFSSDTAYFDYVMLIGGLEYQLKERMLFVKPQNVIVANLLLTIGDLYITEIDYRFASEAYILAKEYDINLTEICNKRLAYIKNLGPTLTTKINTDSITNSRAEEEKHKRTASHLKINRLEIEILKKQKMKHAIIYSFLSLVAAILLIFGLRYRKRKSK